MIGTTLAHYRITGELGAGGMGEVWRAEDTKLGREVALKVLSAEFVNDEHRLERFEREARAVAALNHPAIVTIHSVEESHGVRFLTMELVEGRTLDEVTPDGGMALDAFLDIATPIAEAIAAAHDKGVVHRDLKPQNVMVDDHGRVKVLDFGLAKLQETGDGSDVSEAATEALTGVGMVVGTVPYMSPEQIESLAVDHRTDIFSLGVLLYEMATGERPFTGGSSPALMSSILKDVPTSVVEMRVDLPRHLGRVIGRCLEKNRRDRYQTARDVFNELKALRRESSSSIDIPAASRPRIEQGSAQSRRKPSGDSSPAPGSIPHNGSFWVAVRPFRYTGDDAGLTALSEGLTEDIATGLSRFSYLRVVARTSAVGSFTDGADGQSGGMAVDARYIMEGSLRQAGTKLRLAVQLVDAANGAQIWAENYERLFNPEAVFELQDDLVPRVVSTVADMHGILPRVMSETVQLKAADQLTPYEALLHSFGYNERFTPEALAEARSCLERAVEQSPGNGDCWAMLSLMYSNEYGHWDIQNPVSFEKALQSARTAVQAAPLSSLPYYALAQAHYFRREFPASRTAAERAVSLNPMDGATAAFMGLLIAYSGEWERGCALAERGLQLNPNLPGMYNYTFWHDAYRKKDYRRALDLALKLNTPDSFYQHAVLTMCYAQLGEMEAARKSLQDMLALKPDYGKVARQLHGKWIQPDLVEQLMEGLSKAGLEIAGEEKQVDLSPVSHASSEQRADVGFWVAVLPFKYRSADPGVGALAEGLTEDIVTGMSRFSYLRVLSLSSTSRFADQTVDLRAVGEELGARYVMEGSLRRAGSVLRVAAQLIDAESGAHLWAETYNRPFSPETIFDVQDDLVPRIVSTCADHFGVLARAISEAVRGRPVGEMSPYEALMRGFGYHFRLTPEEHEEAREALEQAVEQAPSNADCLAMLAWVYSHEFAHDFNPRPGSLDRALEAARRAVDIAPSNHFAQQVLAVVLFFRNEIAGCRSAAERSMALNPFDGSNESFFIITFTGEWERGCALIRGAMELNPHHPGWYRAPLGVNEYRKGEYRAAVDEAVKANVADVFWIHLILAAAHSRLGEPEAARKALDNLLAQKPDFARSGRELMAKWFEPELVEDLMDGLCKAGLDEAPLAPSATTPVSATTAASIAVLPFHDMSPAKDQEYLCEGMAEEIMNALTRLNDLRVIARTSAFRYRDEQDLRKVGEALGVDVVLEGSVRRAGQKLRITAQLVDVADDSHIWSERFDREMTDVFEIQDEIADAIADKLHLSLGVSEPVGHSTNNVAAYEALVEARHFFSQFTPAGAERALVCLQRALSLEPDYPDALVLYAFYHVMMGYMFADPREVLPQARSLAERALEMDPHHARAQAVGALLTGWMGRDWSAVESDFRRVLEAAPASARAHELFGLGSLLSMGRLEEALSELDRAVELDPLSALYAGNRGRVLTCSRRFSEAEESCRRGLALDPGQLLVQVELIYALTFQQRYDEAADIGRRAIENHGPAKAPLNALALSLALAGERDEAWRLLDAAAEPGSGAYRSPLTLGLVHAVCSEMDDAMECVHRAIDEYEPLMWYLEVHPMFDVLRDDPRYPGLLRRMNLCQGDDRAQPEPGTPSEAGPRVERHTVGRNAEIQALRTALDAARDGRGSLVCVAGEPGIGKTTLVEGFLADVAAHGSCTVARGRCSERLAGSDAYLPVLEAFDNLLTGGERAAVERVMKTVAPSWFARIASPSRDSREFANLLEEIKDATQERMKREFVACLREVSCSRPLIVFLDDLHWADVSTVDLLSYLSGALDGMNVLVVVTYRPSDMLLENHPFLQIKPDLQTRGLCRELLLEFLQETEVADYLALEFPDHGFPREFQALIHERTEGSPLFMADLARYLQENGSIAKVDGRWTLEHGLPEIERELPESVRAMIERKIERLTEDDLELLTVASVQGYAFDSAVVTRVLGRSADDVEERLENLDRVHALVELSGETELPDHTLNLRYRFVHVLYQNALYGSLRATRKAKLCRAVGQTLEGFHGDTTPGVAHELAALFESGRDFARAARYYLLAARQAGEVFADREAATLAARGIQQVGKLDASPERAQRELELQLALGQALRTTKGFGHTDTGNAYARARELCHDIGEAPQLFPVLFGLWEFHQNQGELASAVEVGGQMLALAETVGEPGLLVAAHTVMADNLLCIGEQVTAREHAAQAVALYDSGQHQSLAAMAGYDSGVAARCMAAVALWQAGYPDQAVTSCNIAFDLAEDLSHPCTQVFGAIFASWIQNWVGGLKVAGEMAERSVEIATEYDIPALAALGRLYQGWASIANGEVEAGTELARKGTEGLHASGFIWGRSLCLGVVAEGCAEAGRFDEALAFFEEAFEHVERTGERFHEAELHRLKGECLLRSASHADPLEAERCFMSAIEIAERQKAMSWVLRATTSLARLWQEQGRLTEAHERLDRVFSWFTEGFETSDLRTAKILLEDLNESKAAEPGAGRTDEVLQLLAETKSIVVLPFANLSPDPDTEYFSDGLTDEIITDLSRVKALRVISRSSAMRLKGDDRGLADIGRDLNCRYVLEGSVRRAADSLRITARLVDAPNDKQLWADKYGGTLDDVFDIQERVSRSIVDALEIQLTPDEAEQLAERPIPDVRAQDCYLRARREIWSFLPGGVDKAVSHLEAGLALIGDNSLLYQGLGEAYFQAINIGAAGGREEEYIGKAERCAEKIFALEPDSPGGYGVKAHLELARGDVHGAGRSWRRVLQAFPRDVQALQLSAHILGWLAGKPDAAMPLVEQLLDIDPLDPMSRLMSVTVPLFAGRFSEALEPGRRMFDLDPVTPVWRSNYVMALSYAGQLDEAEALTKGVEAQPDSDIGTWWMGLCRAAWRRDRSEVLRLTDGPYQQAAAWDAEIPWALASAHAAVGATEEALFWLDRAIDQGMINYPFLSKHDHYLESVRSDERFGRAMERARREWERFDV